MASNTRLTIWNSGLWAGIKLFKGLPNYGYRKFEKVIPARRKVGW